MYMINLVSWYNMISIYKIKPKAKKDKQSLINPNLEKNLIKYTNDIYV